MTRMGWTCLLAPGLLAGGLLGCSQTEQAATQVQSAVQAQATPTLSTTDATFLNDAAQGGITEVTFGQLARQQGRTASVRNFGAQMVTDHTSVNQQLTQLAAAKQINSLTNTADSVHQAAYDKLAAMKGRAFDRGYLNSQVADHTATIKIFQDEAANGTDPDVKAFAAKTLPTLQMHLDEARKLGGRMPAAAT